MELSTLLLLHWHTYREQFCFEVVWLYGATFEDLRSCLDAASFSLNVIAGQREHWWDRGNAVVAEAFAEVLMLGLSHLERVARIKLPAAEPGVTP